jgi:integrase
MKFDLSTRGVVKAIPTDRDRLFPDTLQDGLYVRVQRGEKSWAVRYTVDGVKRQKTLPITQSYRAARDLARELRLEARRGRDVVAERHEELAEKRARARADRERSRRLLGKLVDHYLSDAANKLRPATLSEATRFLRTVLAPLHEHDADALDQRAVAPVLAGIATNRGRTSANRAKAYLSCCLTFGVAAGMLDRNALIGTKRPQPEARRDRVLDDAEMCAIWHATDAATDYGSIVRLLLLTGQRREEVGGLTWAELDLASGLWRLPSSRTKNKRPHDVPLSAQAVAILSSRTRTQARDAVFGRGEEGFSGWSKCKVRLDAAVNLPPWVLHDLRRTAVTIMAETGIPPHIVEAIVNHVSGHKSGVAGTYNRAVYAAEKRAALQRWADHVERIVSGDVCGNVVAFGR